MNEAAVKRKSPHGIILEERKKLSISGVCDVDSFDEETIVVMLENSELIIKGHMLHISRLNVENGELTVDGEICSLTYAESRPSGGLLKRLFR